MGTLLLPEGTQYIVRYHVRLDDPKHRVEKLTYTLPTHLLLPPFGPLFPDMLHFCSQLLTKDNPSLG